MMPSAPGPQDWGTTLRHLTAGMSIGALILLVPAPHAAARVQRPFFSDKGDQTVTTVPDGPFDLEMVLRSTRYGLEHLFREDNTSVPTMIVPAVGATANDGLAAELRTVSGHLPIETLARLVGVSRMSYHKWLNGAGITDTHADRLSDLIAVFRVVGAEHGSALRAFLETTTPAGQPLTLLEQGKSTIVIGLALRSPIVPPAPPPVSDEARRVSRTPGWLRPARRLSWSSPLRTTLEREEARERLSPRALPEAPDEGASEDEDAVAVGVARAFVVE